jgi:hypothetical protein
MKLLFHCADIINIEIKKCILLSHGFECIILNNNVGVASGGGVGGIGFNAEDNVQLWIVDDNKYDEAIRILEMMSQGENESEHESRRGQ